MKKIPPEKLLKAVQGMATELHMPATIPGQNLHLLVEIYLTDDKVGHQINQIMLKSI